MSPEIHRCAAVILVLLFMSIYWLLGRIIVDCLRFISSMLEVSASTHVVMLKQLLYKHKKTQGFAHRNDLDTTKLCKEAIKKCINSLLRNLTGAGQQRC